MAVSIEESIGMARLSYQDGRYTEAKAMLEGITATHPEAAEAWKLLSYSLYGLHQYQAAERAAQSALKAEPSDADCHYALALAIAAESRWGEAIKVYDHVLMLQPNHAYARTGVMDALIHHAKQLTNADNLPLAEQELERAMKLGKSDPRPSVALAEFFIETHRPHRATPIIATAIQNGLTSPELLTLAQQLGVRQHGAPANPAAHTQAVRQSVAQATQKQCPRCGLKSPDWLPKCANCGADMKTGKFTHAAAQVKQEWQVTAYKVMAVLWILYGAAYLILGLAAYFNPKGGDPTLILGIVISSVYVLVGGGLLMENESLQFIAKILCYLVLFLSAISMVVGLATSHWVDAGRSLVELFVAGFMVYLIRFVGGD